MYYTYTHLKCMSDASRARLANMSGSEPTYPYLEKDNSLKPGDWRIIKKSIIAGVEGGLSRRKETHAKKNLQKKKERKMKEKANDSVQ